jgi:hypothetical protein
MGKGAAILLPSGKLIIRAVSTVSFLLIFSFSWIKPVLGLFYTCELKRLPLLFKWNW